MERKLKVLMIGAHMDDPDFCGGGTALKYVAAGHSVRFLSVCDGSCGHHEMSKEEITARRLKELEKAAKLTGIEYDNLLLPECEIPATVENCKRLVRYIREYQPDIIFSHRTNDYHVDHRNTALMVQDASYLLILPNFCPEVKPLAETPVIMYFYDRFTNPIFRPDVVIPTDDVIEKKFEMLDCYVSQMYEWLPYVYGILDQVPTDPKERLEWLHEPRVPRDGTLMTEADIKKVKRIYASEYEEATPAAKYRDKIVERYGEAARGTLFAEAFQVSEYGGALTEENIKVLFPF